MAAEPKYVPLTDAQIAAMLAAQETRLHTLLTPFVQFRDRGLTDAQFCAVVVDRWKAWMGIP
jgi:hypothetical protein